MLAVKTSGFSSTNYKSNPKEQRSKVIKWEQNSTNSKTATPNCYEIKITQHIFYRFVLIIRENNVLPLLENGKCCNWENKKSWLVLKYLIVGPDVSEHAHNWYIT